MTRKNIFRLLLLGAAGMTLAGCGGSSNNSASTTTTPPVVTSFEAQFGTGFNTDFGASPNSQPATPSASDIIAVSLTTQPVSLPTS